MLRISSCLNKRPRFIKFCYQKLIQLLPGIRFANSTTLLMLGVTSPAKCSNMEQRQATVWSSARSVCTCCSWWLCSCHNSAHSSTISRSVLANTVFMDL